ncbi:hypothetical protein [Bosea sp. (in: a-proteobacteria)]|uniref:hypothetical protein n=1 Tax=Bosea sp. (in: a-proteobacteria) TaxID=1871050 RepID=UPI0026242630|nr:hypothetical protein [Bosea sp. (in: a-proteobacteria)]MCO5089938.1 hypothetical protein [Bosea sp. (in: a-proteobacteria)]
MIAASESWQAGASERKADAEKWARPLENELDRCGMLPDTRMGELFSMIKQLNESAVA